MSVPDYETWLGDKYLHARAENAALRQRIAELEAALTARFHAAWMAVVAEEVADSLYEQETAREGE